MSSVIDHMQLRIVQRTVMLVAGGFLLVWCLGLALFAINLKTTDMSPAKADAIVALTGGDERISVAIGLLKLERADRLLISGVNPDTTDRDIQNLVDAPDELFDCCIDLDRSAANTIGNASETAAWVRQYGFRSLIVVTADYHMPRSLLEFRHALPETALIAYPIRSSRFPMDKWYRLQTVRIVVSEYNKYLISFVRIQILSTLGF